jgi:hypothetical protein
MRLAAVSLPQPHRVQRTGRVGADGDIHFTAGLQTNVRDAHCGGRVRHDETACALRRAVLELLDDFVATRRCRRLRELVHAQLCAVLQRGKHAADADLARDELHEALLYGRVSAAGRKPATS